MVEGYLWTEQYPECKRILTRGNNQSMELEENYLHGNWSEDENGYPEFFIINEAVISKLCILGDEAEPCFEGATITNVQFSFEDGFKKQLFSMMKELKEYLNEGGAKVFTRYDVEVGGDLWNALYAHVQSLQGYSIIEVCEEDELKFAVLKDADEKYYRLNFSTSEESIFEPEETLIEITSSYDASTEPQFSIEEIEDKKDQEEESKIEDIEKKEEEIKEEEEEEIEESEEEEVKGTDTYSHEEYQALMDNYSTLEQNYNEIKERNKELESELNTLREFKLNIEREEKEEMINSFYMLSDEDKADVIQNINNYSLDEIEAKLSVICVRNKVSFSSNEEDKDEGLTFNLNNNEQDNNPDMPAWVKAVMDYERSMNN